MAFTLPALQIIDALNGGGVTAVLSGGDPAATHAVSYQPVTGDLGSEDWVLLGTRAGNGNISAVVDAVSTGASTYYWWKCVSTKAGETDVAPLVYQNVTDGEDALHQRIFDAVEAMISAAALTGIEQIKQMKVPAEELVGQLGMPGVILTAFGRPEDMRGGSNAHDDIGYPVFVIFVARDVKDQDTQKTMLMWRQQVSRLFRYQRLAGVPEVWNCFIEPDPVIEVEPDKLNYVGSALLLRFVTREMRGLNSDSKVLAWKSRGVLTWSH